MRCLLTHMYRKSAAYGYAEGQNGLGYIFKQGMGVPKDSAEAVGGYTASPPARVSAWASSTRVQPPRPSLRR